MRAAEIVERDVQADCREMAIQFLAKAESRSVRWLRPVVAFDHNDVDVHGARAASCCATGTAAKPPRKISIVNAVLLIASAATPAVRALIGIPYRGRTRNRI